MTRKACWEVNPLSRLLTEQHVADYGRNYLVTCSQHRALLKSLELKNSAIAGEKREEPTERMNTCQLDPSRFFLQT